MIVERQMECRLAGETELLGESLPQRHFCPQIIVTQGKETRILCLVFLFYVIRRDSYYASLRNSTTAGQILPSALLSFSFAIIYIKQNQK
jgi:hypothetical protein